MEWICKWFIQSLSNNGTRINFADIFNVWGCFCSVQTQQHALNQGKVQSSFYPSLILLLGSFLLLARCLAVCEKKQLHSLLSSPKHENISGVNNLCSSWRIHWLYSHFLSFSFFLWTAGILWCKWHLANGLKTLMPQKAICPLIHNPLADISVLAWLLVFQDFGSSSLINGASNSSITTFLQTSPCISAVRFLSSLCLVITIVLKAYCKLNKPPQTHSVGKLVYI